jgi:ATP-dependent helicase/nuclease subunit B
MERTSEFLVFAGSAGSGKTTALLQLYRAALGSALAEVRPGTTLWLCPTNRARNEVRSRLLDDTLGAAFRPNLATFDDFADAILRSLEQPVAPVSEAAQRILIRRVVTDLKARGELPYFEQIADTAGFLDLVAAFIAELKRGETWPADFNAACARRGNRRDGELGRIYSGYQQALVDGSVYDSEGRFWSARAALEAGHWAGFESLSLVVVDGFTDFTEAQYKILNLLAHKADRLFVSLLTETPLARSELFAKTSGVLDRLKRLGKVSVRTFPQPDVESPAPRAALPPAIAQLSRRLFSNPRETERSPDTAGIEVAAVAGTYREVLWLASRIKQLLLEGVPPDDIVVAVRDLDEYAGMIGDVFSTAGIPLSCEAGIPLARLGPFKTLLNVLALEAEDWQFRRLMALLDSRLFQPAWPEFGDGTAVRDVAEVLRRGELSEGREQILAATERMASPTAPRTNPADEQVGDRQAAAERAWRLLERLSAATAELRRDHEFAGWAAVIALLARELGLSARSLDRETMGTPRTLGETLTAILFDAVRAEKVTRLTSTKLTLRDFTSELADLLEHQRLPPQIAEEGRVRVLSADQVRHIDVPHLFVAGLTESSFPRHRTDDCLYGEGERQELNRLGLSLSHRQVRAQEEMLMFYGVVTRARRRLVLTYPAVGDDGQPLSPSPYLSALKDLFAPDPVLDQLEEQLDPVPRGDRILSPADARVFGMSEALAGRPGIFRRLCEQQSAVRNTLAAVEMNVRRFHTPGFTNFEGWLENPRNIESLQQRFSHTHEYSATQLEAFAECPFRFLVSQVLGLEPPANPGVETDYGRRGTLVHEVLAGLHRTLFEASSVGDVASAPRGEEVAKLFQKNLETRLSARPSESQVQQALERIEQRLLVEWGVAYGQQWDAYVSGLPREAAPRLQPGRFETPFGAARPGEKPAEQPEEQASHQGALQPLVIGKGSEAVRVGGRIDRIDVGVIDGHTVFTVIDYKTGRQSRQKFDTVETGRKLQLVLYTLAVTRLEMAGPGAQPWQIGYWYIRDTGFATAVNQGRVKAGEPPAPIEAAVWQALVVTLEQVIPRLAAGIRAGRFPVVNADPDCTATCAYNTICRVAQIRALPEGLGKVWNP